MLVHQLSNALNEDQANCYRYLLVDPLKPVKIVEPLALENIKDVFSSDEFKAILRPDLSYEPTICPHLILLAKPGEVLEPELLDLTITRIEKERSHYKHYICAWISSELDIQNLAEKMIDLGLQLGRLLSPKQPTFLPFYEHIRLQLIIIINGTFCYDPNPDFIINSTVNAALSGFAKAASKYLGTRGICLNVLNPWITESESWQKTATNLAKFFDTTPESLNENFKKMNPLKRFTDVNDIGHAVSFLLNKKANNYR